jgi:hypothetical protein
VVCESLKAAIFPALFLVGLFGRSSVSLTAQFEVLQLNQNIKPD